MGTKTYYVEIHEDLSVKVTASDIIELSRFDETINVEIRLFTSAAAALIPILQRFVETGSIEEKT